MRRSLVLDAGLDKLQDLLLSMTVGDEISLPDAMHISGLPTGPCEAVLEALTRAGLMTRLRGDAYVRRRLADCAVGTGSEPMTLRVGDEGNQDDNDQSELRET
jgi:hypothetical protein